MAVMSREPEMSSRVQYPSIPELKDGFEELTNRIARKAKLKFRGRKLRTGPLYNAVVLHFMMLPEARQNEIAEAGLRRYEALLQFDEPQEDLGSITPDGGDASGDGFVGIGGEVGSVADTGLKPKRKNKSPKAD